MDKIPLKYKDRREEGETTLRQCQLVQLHLLYVVDAICKKHNIPYILDGGTMLGAMRHNGFIPWDDDLDIAMMKKDYLRFLKIVREELPEDVLVMTPQDTPERAIAFTKIRDAYSFYAEWSMGIPLSRHNGIFIDVFPLEQVANLGPLERPLVKACKRAWLYARGLRCSGGRGFLFALFGGWLSLPLYAFHYLLKVFLKAMLFVSPARTTYYDLRVPFMTPYPKDVLENPVLHRFEDGEFPVPRDADGTLTGFYGNWRQLPPVEKRTGGHGRLILPFQTTRVEGAKEWK